MPWVLWFPIRDFVESQEKRTPEGRECLFASPQCINGFGLFLKITYGAYKNQTHGHVKENLMTTPNCLQSSGILPFHDHLPIHSVVFPFCLFILRNVLIVKIVVDCRKIVRWSYLQIRNRDTDVAIKHRIPRGKGGWDELWDWDWHIFTVDTMYKMDNECEPTV